MEGRSTFQWGEGWGVFRWGASFLSGGVPHGRHQFGGGKEGGGSKKIVGWEASPHAPSPPPHYEKPCELT